MARVEASYQAEYYDEHYESQIASVREQRVQPILCGFYDSLAERVFDVGVPADRPRDPPVRLLEVGCGEGLFAAALQRVAHRRGIPLEYTGADLSRVGLGLAAETVTGTFLPGDAVEVTAALSTGSYDLVFAKNLLHHIDDPASFLTEAARVAGPGGRVVILEARLSQPLNFLASLPFPRRERHFFKGARRNRAAVTAAGLEIAHTEPFSWFPFELACATRLELPRRAFGRIRRPATVRRIARLDERLTRSMPWWSQYSLWTLTPTTKAPAQRAFQQQHYEQHYPRHAQHVREQLEHPLFRSFNDRLARDVLDLGLTDGGNGKPVDAFEAGCGEGLLATSLQAVARARSIDLRYCGADLSPAGLALAAESVDGTFLAGDAIEVTAGLPDASADVVIAKNLLHHLDNPARFLREAKRVARPDGRVVVMEARLGYAPTFLACLFIARQERHFYKGRRRNVAAARTAGLEIVDVRRFGWFPYELAFATRFRSIRRLFSMRRPSTIERFWAADDRMARVMPWCTAYEVWSLAPVDAGGGTNSV